MAPLAMLALFLAALVTDGARSQLELGAVQQALHEMEQGNVTSEVAKSAEEVAERVDEVAEALESGKNITKEQKRQIVAGAIQKLQGLQGLFQEFLRAAGNSSAGETPETLVEKELVRSEDALKLAQLSAVQQALHKMENGHLTNEVAKSAKEVAEAVDKVAEELENGSKGMTKEQKGKMVAGAIQKLQGLQGLFEKSLKAAANHSASEKLETLEKELALKKTELAESEDVLKLEKLEKELGLKKQELQELVNKKASAKAGTLADEKEKKEQEELVAALVGKAEELKTAKGVAAKKSPEAKLPAPIQAIVTTLQSKVLVATAELAKMDAEEVAREHKADEAAKEASQGKDAKKAQRLSSMLKFLAKEEQHTFTKLRAAKEHNLHELQQAVRGVESGDVAAVQKVMAEMQKDVKSADAKSHNFLY
mmetsp:Transcript_1822/g.3641  ORF Transcript_1822/g.3641 Transcript_1822/m.3641 type:complete len:424 (+) Transcript_1822:59-1330(+)